MLGYMVETYPHISLELIKDLRLDDAEYALLGATSYNDPNLSASPPAHTVSVYPRFSRIEARQMWRTSSLAKAMAPSLNLSLGTEDDDEDVEALDSLRARIDEARAARSRLRSGLHETTGVNAIPPVPQAYQQLYPSQPNAQHGHQSQPIPIPSPFQYQVPSPNIASQYPSYIQQQSPKKPLNRLAPGGTATSTYGGPPFQHRSTPTHPFSQQHPSQMRLEQPQYSSNYSSSQSSHLQPQYGSIVDEAVTPTSIPHLDEFGSSNHPPNRFEEETEALAYALGLTTYSSSPRRGGFKLPTAATPQSSSAWPDPSSSSYDNSSIDQQLQSANQDDHELQQNSVIDFFSDYDLNMPYDNPQLSVLHQLGLQGGFGMSTPIDETARGKSNGHSGTTPTPSSATMSNDNHQNTVQWLQPIRGIN